MGYGYYEIPRPFSSHPMKRGYSVACKCHYRGCKARIDRGLAYLCYGCTWYFCEKHLTTAYDRDDEPIEFDGALGRDTQCCRSCAAQAEADSLKTA